MAQRQQSVKQMSVFVDEVFYPSSCWISDDMGGLVARDESVD